MLELVQINMKGIQDTGNRNCLTDNLSSFAQSFSSIIDSNDEFMVLRGVNLDYSGFGCYRLAISAVFFVT